MQTAPRLLVTVKEAAESLALSRAHVYELARTGELERVKIGRAVRITHASLEALVERRGTSAPTRLRTPA
jgi:excisionase family DNA binding protein